MFGIKAPAVEILEGAPVPEDTRCDGAPWQTGCRRSPSAKLLVLLGDGSVVGACGWHLRDYRAEIAERAQEERCKALRGPFLALAARLVENGLASTKPNDPTVPNVWVIVDKNDEVRVSMSGKDFARLCAAAGVSEAIALVANES